MLFRSGQILSGITFFDVETGMEQSGMATGEYMRVNSNSVEEDYEGPWSWYQFQLDGCDYEFQEPQMGELVISIVACDGKAIEEPIVSTYYLYEGD